jgi:hypothetical protein
MGRVMAYVEVFNAVLEKGSGHLEVGAAFELGNCPGAWVPSRYLST